MVVGSWWLGGSVARLLEALAATARKAASVARWRAFGDPVIRGAVAEAGSGERARQRRAASGEQRGERRPRRRKRGAAQRPGVLTRPCTAQQPSTEQMRADSAGTRMVVTTLLHSSARAPNMLMRCTVTKSSWPASIASCNLRNPAGNTGAAAGKQAAAS